MDEVDKFTKPNKIQRDMFRLGGILFHKSQILDGRWYMMSANMKTIESVAAQNINLFTPVMGRWSPLLPSRLDPHGSVQPLRTQVYLQKIPELLLYPTGPLTI